MMLTPGTHLGPYEVLAPLTRTTIELPSNARLALGTQTPLEGVDSTVPLVGSYVSGTMKQP